VSGARTWQHTTTVTLNIGQHFTVPANGVLEAVPCDLRYTAVRQVGPFVTSSQAPPAGVAGDAYVQSESPAKFWYVQNFINWSVDAIENGSSMYIYIRP
jgi:hypothetical protein